MFKRVVVSGSSMAPAIAAGQRLIVRTGYYRRRTPQRGDLVLVQHPTVDIRIIKRVVAVPGESWDGGTLAADEFAVRGDNAAASTDSATFGAVGRAAILGRVAFSYRPWRRVR